MLTGKLAWMSAGVLFLAGIAAAQTTSIAGEVKGEDGKPLQNAVVKIERKDIRGNYKTKTNKKGEFFHAGLPIGMYKVTLEVNGKDVDSVDNVRTTLGDPRPIIFDLAERKKRQDALQRAAETGQLTAEQAREMTPEQKAALEKASKERQQQMAKNKALNDAFNQGMQALQAKQYDAAVEGFLKAAEVDPKQHVVWAHLADSYIGLAGTKTGADQEAALAKGLENYIKALELKPDEAAYHNNYALALARSKKFPEAQAELTKAAQLDPPNAGRYFFNLGALLVNSGQHDAAAEAFRQAIQADPNYAEAHYQLAMCLTSKVQYAADGKIVPPPGLREALESYLKIAPTGPNAQGAKDMLAAMEAGVQTKYENPSAQKKSKKK